MIDSLREAFDRQLEQFRDINKLSRELTENTVNFEGSPTNGLSHQHHVQTNVLLQHISSQLHWIQRAMLEERGEDFEG